MSTPLTATQSFFIRILRDHLNQTPTEPIGGIDWQELTELAFKHSVNGILYRQCRGFLPPELYPRLTQLYAAELYHYRNRVDIFNRLSGALADASIPFYTVKGLEVAALYPFPALRTMGDCDIVVHPDEKPKAHEILLEQGLRCHSTGTNEWVYFQDDFEFELHDHLLYHEPANNDAELAFADTAWDYVSESNEKHDKLDDSFHYVFLLLHLKKHMIHRGAGVRLFMDLYEARKKWELNDEWIADAVKSLGLERFKTVCDEITEYWFGCPDGEHRTDFDEMALGILDSGTFGFHGEKNDLNLKMINLNRGSKPLWWKKFRKLIRGVFPSYRNMRTVEHYRRLDGHPWLLPFFWIYRWYRALRYRQVDNGKKIIAEASISKSKMKDFENELNKWGLSVLDI